MTRQLQNLYSLTAEYLSHLVTDILDITLLLTCSSCTCFSTPLASSNPNFLPWISSNPSSPPIQTPPNPHLHKSHVYENDQQQRGQEEEEEEPASPNPDTDPNESSGSWSFGGLIKTFATRSESVIQTYRRDLEEFGSELKKESETIKQVASRAVLDLPGSLEAGASVAHCSLESVWKGTANIISQSKDALLAIPDSDANSSRRHSRFEAQVLAVQNDPSTFVEAPEDMEDFDKWKLGFRLEEEEEEIEVLLYENGVLEGFYEKFVPGVVDINTFWTRYFYRVYKLQQAKDARVSWEVDDDNNQNAVENKEVKGNKDEGNLTNKEKFRTLESIEGKKPIEEATKEEEIAEDLQEPADESIKTALFATSEPQVASKDDNLEQKENDKSKLEDKASVGAKPEPAEDEENLGWDEIEDLRNHDDKRVGGPAGSPRKEDPRKRLSVAEDDEDLSWDIEDDEDESTKT